MDSRESGNDSFAKVSVAGEPRPKPRPAYPPPVYPRVGGGTILRVPTAENSYFQRPHRLTAIPEGGALHRTPAESTVGHSATVTIADDDSPPGVSISSPSEVKEGGDAVFTLTRSGSTILGLRARVHVHGTSHVLSPEARRLLGKAAYNVFGRHPLAFGRFRKSVLWNHDYVDVDFAPGNATATLTLGTQDDETAEGGGVVNVRIIPNYSHYYPGAPRYAHILVRDDDTTVLTLELVGPRR